MLRRDFVRAAIAVGISPKILLSQQAKQQLPLPAPTPWTLGLNPKTPLPHTEVLEGIAEGEVRFFSQTQMATLRRLSDLLMPSLDGKPSASQAETPLFLDFLIGSSPATRQQLYTSGLDWLDGESKKRYKTTFAQLSETQADELLKPWLQTWMNDNPPTEQHAAFINIAHDDIRSATVNSKAWSDAPQDETEEKTEVALYWSPIEPDIDLVKTECGGAPPHVQAVPKSAHPMPTYPR